MAADTTQLNGQWQSAVGRIGEVVQGDQDLHQSIGLIVGTALGGLAGKPEFGVDWLDVLDRPVLVAVPRAVLKVQTALERWEKRIVIDRIEVELGDPGASNATVRWSRVGSSTVNTTRVPL